MLSDEIVDLVLETAVLCWIGYTYITTNTLSTELKVVAIFIGVLIIKALRNIVRIIKFRLSNKLIQSGVSMQGGIYGDLETMIRSNPEFRNYCRMLLSKYDNGGMY